MVHLSLNLALALTHEEMLEKPLSRTPSALFISFRHLQMLIYNSFAQNNRQNQIVRDSGTICGSKGNNRIGSSFTRKFSTPPKNAELKIYLTI